MTVTEALRTTAKATAPRQVLDTIGLLCPYPYIRAKEALDALPAGASLEILTDSEATACSSVPILASQHGYALTSTKDGEVWRLVVTKA